MKPSKCSHKDCDKIKCIDCKCDFTPVYDFKTGIIKSRRCETCRRLHEQSKKKPLQPKGKKTSNKSIKTKRCTNWKDKDLQGLIKHVQSEFCNPYIRERDKVLYGKCISCNSGITEAGHRFPVGSYNGMRFLINNIHGQETSCNRFKSGNLDEYDKGLINRYGQEYLDKLKKQAQIYKASNHKFTRFDVIAIGETYKHLLDNEIWIDEPKIFDNWKQKIIKDNRRRF